MGAVLLLFSLFLFFQLGSQTVSAGGAFAADPAFWPRLAVGGMVLFAALNLFASLRDKATKERFYGMGEELLLWLRSLEFALWFMAYVLATPLIGYLAASLLFSVCLAVRVGYRSNRALGLAALVGLGTVLVFKSFLQVKIPGGSIYEVLPGAVRNFFILYL